MIPKSEMLQHYQALATSHTAILPVQKQAALHMQALKIPSKKDEAWHYTPVAPLLEYQFLPANHYHPDMSYEDISRYLTGEKQDVRIVLVNGCYIPELSHIPKGISGLSIASILSAVQVGSPEVVNYLATLSGDGSDLFSALNTADFMDGALIKIARDAVIEKPVELLHLSASTDSALILQPRNLIILEDNAKATVVESYASSGDTPLLNNIITEVFLGKNASLEHPRLQNESGSTRHLSGLYIHQGRDSHYQGTTASFGSAWSRSEFNVELASEGALCEIDGLYLAGDNQIASTHINIAHSSPGCTSRVYFKGILMEKGRGVFDGNVIVHKNAQKSDAQLRNANLLLSRKAEIDTKPVLQINADDVQCSHGATVGQIDPAMLYYLRTRGIPEQQARKLISLGFAREIIETYAWKAMHGRVEMLLEARLATQNNLVH